MPLFIEVGDGVFEEWSSGEFPDDLPQEDVIRIIEEKVSSSSLLMQNVRTNDQERFYAVSRIFTNSVALSFFLFLFFSITERTIRSGGHSNCSRGQPNYVC